MAIDFDLKRLVVKFKLKCVSVLIKKTATLMLQPYTGSKNIFKSALSADDVHDKPAHKPSTAVHNKRNDRYHAYYIHLHMFCRLLHIITNIAKPTAIRVEAAGRPKCIYRRNPYPA
jgi:hypothetical protein